jgi:hypothetical protein
MVSECEHVPHVIAYGPRWLFPTKAFSNGSHAAEDREVFLIDFLLREKLFTFLLFFLRRILFILEVAIVILITDIG